MCPSRPIASSITREFADKLYDEVAPTGPDDLALIRREPLGVVAAIVPWNYPLIITAWKIGPALLAGNSVVLKPAEQSPLSAIRLGQLALEAGLPEGVLNVVPGFGEEAGKPLALHRDVDMISFTGSTEVGKLMMRYAGESNLKRVSLECGGKSPHVVLHDADIKAAAEAIAWGIYYNAGETCHAGSRVLADAPDQGCASRGDRRFRRGHHARPSARSGDPDGGADRCRPYGPRAASFVRLRCRRGRPDRLRRQAGLHGERRLLYPSAPSSIMWHPA